MVFSLACSTPSAWRNVKNLDIKDIYQKRLKIFEKKCCTSSRSAYSYVFRGERKVAKPGETAKPHYQR